MQEGVDPSDATAFSLYCCVCLSKVFSVRVTYCICVLRVCECLHEGLQALSDVSLPQWYRSVGFRALQGSLVLLAAHQAQHGSVQILVLLL